MRNELINILCVHILISSILLLLQEDYEKLIESLPLNIKNIKNFIYANNTRFYMTEEYSNKPIISGTMIFVILLPYWFLLFV